MNLGHFFLLSLSGAQKGLESVNDFLLGKIICDAARFRVFKFSY